MSAVTTVTAVAGMLGSALVAGVFFAFSSFIMKALARVPAHEGIAAMQSINIVVLNPSFLGVFMGTTAISGLVAGLAMVSLETPAAPWLLAGALTYIGGTFAVTGLGNVPLNNRLAAISATDPQAIALWQHYLRRWTLLNTVRTVAAAAATLLLTLGLLHSGGV